MSNGGAPPRTLRLRRRSDGRLIELPPSLQIGSGGEARVFALPDDPALAAKIYRKPTPERERKLSLMIARPPAGLSKTEPSLAWPLELVDAVEGGFAGFLMPRLKDQHRAFDLYNPATRKTRLPLFDWGYLHRAGRNLAAVAASLHDAGYIIGDINESNVLVASTATVTLIDTDSFRVPDPETGTAFFSPVAKPEFTAPELQGKSFTVTDQTLEDDLFGVATMLFLMLMEGTHPFAGEYDAAVEPPLFGERIAKGHFPYARSPPGPCRPRRLAPPIEILHPELREMFVRCFEDGHADPKARPSAAAWKDALAKAESELQRCMENEQHRYGVHLAECPWCARTKLLGGRDPFPSRASVAKRPPPREDPSRDRVEPTEPGEDASQPPAGVTAPVPGIAAVNVGLLFSIFGLALACLPLAGFLGTIGGISSIVGVQKSSPKGIARTLLAVLVGGFATYLAVVKAAGPRADQPSCPHVYVHDGAHWRLDADMLSGSLFRGAESDDVARLDHAAASKSPIRVRIANELPERDFIDRVVLEVVDHPAGTSALATPEGELALVGEPRPPLSAVDGRRRDWLAAVGSEDAGAWEGSPADHTDRETRPTDTLEVTLPRPASPGDGFLVLRARNTEVATKALYQYLGRMGPGLGTLLGLAQSSARYPYRQRIADELERLGALLTVEVLEPDGWKTVENLKPIGPAVLRSLAIPLPLPEGDVIRVRLTATPGAWEIDRIAIASTNGEQPPAVLVSASRAVGSDGGDRTAALAETDENRVALEQGQRVDLSFAAPPLPIDGGARSVFLRMRGYYEVDFEGGGWLNPLAIYRHATGSDSAPRFFLRSLAER